MKLKKTIIIILSTLMIGCSSLVADRDPIEQASLVRIDVELKMLSEQCADSEKIKKGLYSLLKETGFLVVYSDYIKQNKDTYKIIQIIHKNIVQMNSRYTNNEPTEQYCKTKLIILEAMARQGLKAIKARD